MDLGLQEEGRDGGGGGGLGQLLVMGIKLKDKIE